MPVYSHSRLSTYEDCPLKYKLCYIDGIKRDTEGIEAFMGSMVHDTLQKCYDDLRFTKLNSMDDLLAFYNKTWQKNWRDSIVITKKDLTSEHYRALGEKLVTNYYQRFAPFDSDVTIGTELTLNFSLDDENKYRMTGYIDRLSRTKDGIHEIHDYKTSAHLPGQHEAELDRQLGLYHIGVQKKWPDIKRIKLVWHYLAFDTDLVSHRTPESISKLVQRTKSLIDEIESTKDEQFKPKESKLCDWCEYPDLCPQRKHLYKVESLPANQYLKEPGVVLVNKYAELKHKSSEISDEIEQVREALLNYAMTEQVGVIKGSDRMAKVKVETKLKFPGKSDEMRSELENTIKRAEKWDEVSQLDTTALGEAVESVKWNKKLIDSIMKYGTIEESRSVRLSKLKEDKED